MSNYHFSFPLFLLLMQVEEIQHSIYETYYSQGLVYDFRCS
jgi:hypothetical protein